MVWLNTIQHNMIQYNMTRYYLVQCNIMRQGTMWHNRIQYDTIHWYHTIPYHMTYIQYDTMQNETIWYRMTQLRYNMIQCITIRLDTIRYYTKLIDTKRYNTTKLIVLLSELWLGLSCSVMNPFPTNNWEPQAILGRHWQVRWPFSTSQVLQDGSLAPLFDMHGGKSTLELMEEIFSNKAVGRSPWQRRSSRRLDDRWVP